MNLDELRKRIDALDTEILRCLNERARCALEIGDIKRANNAVYYVPERERDVYDKLLRENQGPLTEAANKAIYREIISAVRALEKLYLIHI